MENNKCPICGSTEKCSQKIVPDNYIYIQCHTYSFECFIDEDLLEMADGDEIKEKALDLIVEHLLRNRFCNVDGHQFKWGFYYEPSYKTKETDKPYMVNMAERIGSYPENIAELVDRALVNLSIRFPNYGEFIVPYPNEKRTVFDHKGFNGKYYGIHEIMEEFSLLKETDHEHVYKISANGWERIQELQNRNQEIRQGFIAMSFREETKPIRESFRQAIAESGYAVRIIDEKEHNNQIVPEIFYEIQRSRFVVVDVTYPNYGAYYEAGYAQALGKEVIICCRDAEFHSKESRPHFDISQKSMIVWKDESELIERLKRRIEATVSR